MKKMTVTWLHRIISLCLVLTILTVFSTVALALPDNKSLMGELIVTGKSLNGSNPFAILNGEQVISGNTVFSSSTIATTESSSATVELGKLGYVSLTPGSVLNLSFDEKSISGTLSAGNIKVFNNKGILVKIQTPNGVVGNETAGNLEAETLNASAGNSSASSSAGSKPTLGGVSVVLAGVIIIVAVTAITLAVSNDVILDSNSDISASPIK